MLRNFIKRELNRSEQELRVSHDYVRYILDTSLSAFLRFAKIFSISKYRKKLPADAHHVARIVAARDEDCGTCVQIEINIALKNEVPESLLRSVVDRRPEELPDELASIYHFVDALVSKKPNESELRERVKETYGQEGLIELSLAIGTSRFLPIVKRTLGYGTACSLVDLEIERKV